jgi:hypothetical protein
VRGTNADLIGVALGKKPDPQRGKSTAEPTCGRWAISEDVGDNRTSWPSKISYSSGSEIGVRDATATKYLINRASGIPKSFIVHFVSITSKAGK